ncbi:hypothetical protein F3Y22_tig00002919pilonHSYRG00344 [Hibiscus syriacus]|uniref:Bifunctional inhibitor/plant lipid transfer protein/seed storage helical domain-containing protein n=1 Tax=Hibiscus syriacus TaxID=106335 RepID=A0A6A3CMJ4_HIBSY|nr:hypothetical protein F3Y22_tig00002919pilonHSYRG00344 [Hibiscus syriacus]
MISTFTPCLNFITGSSGNGSSSPTQGCCSSLKSIMSSSMDCACLIFTANIPLQLPITEPWHLVSPELVTWVAYQCSARDNHSISCVLQQLALLYQLQALFPSYLSPTLPPTAASPLSPELPKL